MLENPLGVVPFVPMVNRGRLLNRAGRSELASVAPLADGINELATGMMVTSEFYLTPRRYATGVQVPTDGANRERLQEEARAYWDEATKSKTWLAGQGVQFGQFPEADMAGFVAGINLLTSALASIGGLPPDDLGLNQVNPASAEARRAAETVLVLRAQEKQSAFGRAYVRAMRLAVAARDGLRLRDLPADYSRLSVDWKDPATQAIAQEMDAAVKGKESGIYDTEAAQQRVGMGPVERAAVKARAEEAANLSATADVRARMTAARDLVASDGLTLNAAMAAVGLLQAAATNSAESA
ncbi:MAG TPA: phage portal protein [Acidimicrobiia bacterium]|nr:phage portal protein [Acidimicrobiia bacterium]